MITARFPSPFDFKIMYTINITFKVPLEIYDEWLSWMQRSWQPLLSETIDNTGFQTHRLLGHDDEHGITTVFQLQLPSRAILNQYLENKEAALQQHIIDKWGENVLFFRTILERLD